MGNAFSGIEIRAKGQTITGNVIGANGVDGISLGFPDNIITDSDASNNVIQGNSIGTDVFGNIDLGNALGGIVMRDDPANDNLIGGNEIGEGNMIAFNDGIQSGIGSFNGTGNSILGNRIHSNGGPGIDHFDPFGPNTNDPGDADGGINNGQNYPEIIAAFRLVNASVIKFKLNSVPLNDYWIEVFANTSCDGSGNGEGKSRLGGSLVTLGAAPTSVFTFDFGLVFAGEEITMTATLKAGPTDYTDTSEFSACFTPKTPKCYGQMLTQIGSNGPEFLTGTSGFDVISGRGGGDNISGLGDVDVICGGSGDDIINGGPGNDIIEANSGADIVNGQGGDDTLKGQGGEDTLDGNAGQDVLRGANADDELSGGADNDRLYGGAGNDDLFGEGGNDKHFGETGGNDLCDGGPGNGDTGSVSCDGNQVNIP
ncbi:MAG: calcium-binding protein [Dehalococcoidia bacterium]